MSFYGANSQAQQSGDNLLNPLRVFLEKHHLGMEQLAGLLRVSPETLEERFSEGVAPPASWLAIAVLFDIKSQRGRRRTDSLAKALFCKLSTERKICFFFLQQDWIP